jgi:tetratricopeptide (TPR) repeat protein
LIDESEDIKRKKLENDLEICKKKLLAEPKNLNLLTEKTHLAIKLKDIEQVASTVNEASLIAPNQHVFSVLKGDLFFVLGKYKDAIISYYEASEIGLGSKDYRVWLKLARSHFLIEEYLDAATYYKEALTLCYEKAPTLRRDSEDDYLIFHEYAVTLDKLNRHHESIQLYNSSLCLQHNYRSSSYAKKRSYRKIYS